MWFNMQIHKTWIRIWIQYSYTINMIWRSGCSKYGDQGVSDPNDDADFCFGAEAAASHWVSEAGFSKRRKAVASLKWGGPQRHRSEVGRGKWLRRVTTVTARGGWRRAAADDGGPLLVTRPGCCEWDRPWRVMDGGPLRVTRVGASEPGWPLANLPGSTLVFSICKLGRSIMGNNETHYYPLLT